MCILYRVMVVMQEHFNDTFTDKLTPYRRLKGFERTSKVLEAFNFNDLYDNWSKLCKNRRTRDKNTTAEICNIVQVLFSCPFFNSNIALPSFCFITSCHINSSTVVCHPYAVIIECI